MQMLDIAERRGLKLEIQHYTSALTVGDNSGTAIECGVQAALDQQFHIMAKSASANKADLRATD
jgi:hypothetical protein